jgi:valyl-tRNA synthetase
MTMLCTYLTNKIPFKKIYLHSMVRDSQGKKMSKSLGNVIDPLDVIYGITLEEMIKKVESNSNINVNEISRSVQLIKKNFKEGILECGKNKI